jgi:hypothetical protein
MLLFMVQRVHSLLPRSPLTVVSTHSPPKRDSAGFSLIPYLIEHPKLLTLYSFLAAAGSKLPQYHNTFAE